MSTPASGQIAMSDLNIALGYSSTATISLNDSAVRNLTAIAAIEVNQSTISMSEMYNLGGAYSYTISSNTTNFDMRATLVALGWNQSSSVNFTVTVASGIVVSAASSSSYAYYVSPTFPSGSTLTLINQGYIVGAGGTGGSGVSNGVGGGGTAGGPAIYVGYTLHINNTGIIGGGGGGGGAGGGILVAHLG